MYRCMFASPAASLQQIVSELTSPLPMAGPSGQKDTPPLAPPPSTVLPFLVDPTHQRGVGCEAGEGGCLLVSFDSSVPGYFIGQTPLTLWGNIPGRCVSQIGSFLISGAV